MGIMVEEKATAGEMGDEELILKAYSLLTKTVERLQAENWL